MKTKTCNHTPGPWACELGWNDKDQFTITAPLSKTLSDNTRGLIASTDYTPFEVSREANARLIAAAPQMLEALRAVKEAFAHLKPLELGEAAEKALDMTDDAIWMASL